MPIKSCTILNRIISRYIILYIKRFTKNNFFVEKNPTIVNFPLSHIEFGDILAESVKDKHSEGTTYDLIANVVHDGSRSRMETTGSTFPMPAPGNGLR